MDFQGSSIVSMSELIPSPFKKVAQLELEHPENKPDLKKILFRFYHLQ